MPTLILMSQPTEGIVCEIDNVSVSNRSESFGKGRLYVTEECVSWIKPDQQGFLLSYPEISLHAISKDLTTFPEECLYLILSTGHSESESDSDEAQMEEHVINGGSRGSDDHELMFSPENKGSLQTMFDAMSRCQALHPDPADANSSDDEQHYEDGVVTANGDGSGDLIHAHAEEDQFDDDEEEGGNGDGGMEEHMGDGDS